MFMTELQRRSMTAGIQLFPIDIMNTFRKELCMNQHNPNSPRPTCATRYTHVLAKAPENTVFGGSGTIRAAVVAELFRTLAKGNWVGNLSTCQGCIDAAIPWPEIALEIPIGAGVRDPGVWVAESGMSLTITVRRSRPGIRSARRLHPASSYA